MNTARLVKGLSQSHSGGADLFGLVLHGDHANEYLMALHDEAVVDAFDRFRQR